MATAKKPRFGRKTLLTPKTAALIEKHLRAGLWRHNAAQLVGISPRSIEGWMARGRAELEDAMQEAEETGRLPALGRYGQFAAMVYAVEAETEQQMVGVVIECAKQKDDPALRFKAATWWLERKRNMVYGKGALRVDLHQDQSEDDGGDDVEEVLEKLAQAENNVIRLTAAAGGADGGAEST